MRRTLFEQRGGRIGVKRGEATERTVSPYSTAVGYAPDGGESDADDEAAGEHSSGSKVISGRG